jgi:hypothetical protein
VPIPETGTAGSKKAAGAQGDYLGAESGAKGGHFPGDGSMRFKYPVFVTPHAVVRFQERVANLPAAQAINLIQAALQDNRQVVGVQIYNKQRRPVFRARYREVEYLIPVARRRDREWPYVPTILLPGMRTHILHERSGWHWK